MNPCERMKRAIQNYEGLTDGLITSAESLTQQKNMLSNTVREERSKIDRIKTNIQDLGSDFLNIGSIPIASFAVESFFFSLETFCEGSEMTHKFAFNLYSYV